MINHPRKPNPGYANGTVWDCGETGLCSIMREWPPHPARVGQDAGSNPAARKNAVRFGSVIEVW